MSRNQVFYWIIVVFAVGLTIANGADKNIQAVLGWLTVAVLAQSRARKG